MSTASELKLLTLLNVSAVKRPRELDVPGGHRGSPSTSRSSSVVPSSTEPPSATASGTPKGRTNGATQSNGNGEPPVKRRRSVVFGGELGPSGSTYGKKAKKGKGKEKAEEKGDEPVAVAMDGEDDEELDVESGDEGETAGECSRRALTRNGRLSAGDDNFLAHFGPAPEILSEGSMSSATSNAWEISRKELRGYGRVVEMLPKGVKAAEGKKNRVSGGDLLG